jgi:hypothetical protein
MICEWQLCTARALLRVKVIPRHSDGVPKQMLGSMLGNHPSKNPHDDNM